MFFCLRVDLDYVPWDTPDAKEFGHAEPAVLLRMLELAKATGYKLHFFASNRFLRALPAAAHAVLNDGLHLDWLCKRPDQAEQRFVKAQELFEAIGSPPVGFACKAAWPEEAAFSGAESLKFLSAMPGAAPPGVRLIPVETKTAKEAYRAGTSVKSWSDSAKVQIRDAASRNRQVTLVVRPQVLGRYDPKLVFLHEILDLAEAVGATPGTLRELIAGDEAPH